MATAANGTEIEAGGSCLRPPRAYWIESSRESADQLAFFCALALALGFGIYTRVQVG